MQSGASIDQPDLPHFTGHEFITRARERLTLDVPAALSDLTATAVRGDLDLDDELWKKAGVQATKPAAVLIPIVERAEPTVLLTSAHAGPQEPLRTDRVPRWQDRRGRCDTARRRFA